MKRLILHTKEVSQPYMIFLKWILLSSLVGIIVGLFGTLFHFAIEKATHLRATYPLIIYTMPVAGCLIVFLYQLAHEPNELNTNLVLESIRSSKHLPLVMAPLIFISTVLTHLVGGSSGREGAALQLGGSLSTFLGKRFHLDENDRRMITMCGMSAAFAALFRTPIAATVFSMEVISVGVMYYAALVPCILAALIGYAISGYFGIPATRYHLNLITSFDILVTLKVVVLGIFCAIVSIMFCKILHWIAARYAKYFKNLYLRIGIGSLIIIALTYLCQSRAYLGAGMETIESALYGSALPLAFLLKIIFTAFTLGCGFKGGEIVPSFFVGATFGAMIGPLLGLPASFSASLGLIALFCGVTNCPMTAFILSTEMFGSESGIYFMMIIAVSYMLSGYCSLYSKQKIMYSKLKPVFRNEFTH